MLVLFASTVRARCKVSLTRERRSSHSRATRESNGNARELLAIARVAREWTRNYCNHHLIDYWTHPTTSWEDGRRFSLLKTRLNLSGSFFLASFFFWKSRKQCNEYEKETYMVSNQKKKDEMHECIVISWTQLYIHVYIVPFVFVFPYLNWTLRWSIVCV